MEEMNHLQEQQQQALHMFDNACALPKKKNNNPEIVLLVRVTVLRIIKPK